MNCGIYKKNKLKNKGLRLHDFGYSYESPKRIKPCSFDQCFGCGKNETYVVVNIEELSVDGAKSVRYLCIDCYEIYLKKSSTKGSKLEECYCCNKNARKKDLFKHLSTNLKTCIACVYHVAENTKLFYDLVTRGYVCNVAKKCVYCGLKATKEEKFEENKYSLVCDECHIKPEKHKLCDSEKNYENNSKKWKKCFICERYFYLDRNENPYYTKLVSTGKYLCNENASCGQIYYDGVFIHWGLGGDPIYSKKLKLQDSGSLVQRKAQSLMDFGITRRVIGIAFGKRIKCPKPDCDAPKVRPGCIPYWFTQWSKRFKITERLVCQCEVYKIQRICKDQETNRSVLKLSDSKNAYGVVVDTMRGLMEHASKKGFDACDAWKIRISKKNYPHSYTELDMNKVKLNCECFHCSHRFSYRLNHGFWTWTRFVDLLAEFIKKEEGI